jgi:hypothetical protein
MEGEVVPFAYRQLCPIRKVCESHLSRRGVWKGKSAFSNVSVRMKNSTPALWIETWNRMLF